MQETELSQGECSQPPLHDDVSDESFSDFSDSDVDNDDHDMHSDHEFPICPKWDEKKIEVVRHLVGDPLDSRKTRSQFHNSYSTFELNIVDMCFIMVGYDPCTYQDASLDPIWKESMQ